MKIKWRLRMAAAQREVWTGAQLRRLLAERAGLQLSSASVSALLTKQPAQVKLETLLRKEETGSKNKGAPSSSLRILERQGGVFL